MCLQNKLLSEKQIIAMLHDNNPLAWGNLYNKYASAMYGLIYNLTEDKLLAEEIFTNAFLELKQKQILSKIKYALYPIILRYTYSYTIKHLRIFGINSKTLNPPKGAKIIYMLTTECNSLNEAASILNINAKENIKRIHAEFLNLRTLNTIPANAHRVDRIYIESVLQTQTNLL